MHVWLILGCCGLLLSSRVDAANGIRRCLGPDGVSIYTDQPCEKFNAVDRKPQEVIANLAAPTGFTRRGCARRPDTLLFDLRRAIESDNVNQLAGVYHWPGISRRGAHGIMDRLERVTARSLASVELVFPQSTPVRDDPGAFPDTMPVEDPIGVHIEQNMPGEIVPSFELDLQLVRHADCWWVRF